MNPESVPNQTGESYPSVPKRTLGLLLVAAALNFALGFFTTYTVEWLQWVNQVVGVLCIVVAGFFFLRQYRRP